MIGPKSYNPPIFIAYGRSQQDIVDVPHAVAVLVFSGIVAFCLSMKLSMGFEYNRSRCDIVSRDCEYLTADIYGLWQLQSYFEYNHICNDFPK